MPSKRSSSSKPAADSKQPHEKAAPLDRASQPESTPDFDDPVNEASEESFPASDAPAWTDTAATKNGD